MINKRVSPKKKAETAHQGHAYTTEFQSPASRHDPTRSFARSMAFSLGPVCLRCPSSYQNSERLAQQTAKGADNSEHQLRWRRAQAGMLSSKIWETFMLRLRGTLDNAFS